MSAISEAFDALSREERLQLLVDLEFEDPMRYASRDEIDLRYCCLVYEVQNELANCYVRGTWSGSAKVIANYATKAPKHILKDSTVFPVHMKAVAEGIKAVKLSITHS